MKEASTRPFSLALFLLIVFGLSLAIRWRRRSGFLLSGLLLLVLGAVLLWRGNWNGVSGIADQPLGDGYRAVGAVVPEIT